MWKRRNISRYSLVDGSFDRTLRGFLKIKSALNFAPQWTKYWVVLDACTLELFRAKTDINPMFHTDLRRLQIMPGECFTKRRNSFRCVGTDCDLLISCSTKDDLVRWMNAAGLASIGYDEDNNEGVGIRRNRYKNCSVRIYRRNISRDIEEAAKQTTDDSSSLYSSCDSYQDVRTPELRHSMNPMASAVRSAVCFNGASTDKDDIMRLVDYVDITSGLTRKQTMKRRAVELAPDPVLNDILHRQMQNERQLKALLDDVGKIDALLNAPKITGDAIAAFEQNHSDIVPELRKRKSSGFLEEDMLNCSIGTGSDSSNFEAV